MTLNDLKKFIGVLDANPPTFQKSAPRSKAFLRIAKFLEDTVKPGGSYDLDLNPHPVWQIIEARLAAAIDEIGTSELSDDEVVAWQMYNDGVIIKSGEVIIGLDVIPMPRSHAWAEPPGLTERIAGTLDLLLITHPHADHYDHPLARACLQMGKPVVMPEIVAREWEIDSNLHRAADGWSLDVDDLSIVAHQGFHVWRETMEELPLAYYEVTCQQGFSFVFGGDVDCTKRVARTPGKRIDLLFLPWRNPNKAYEDNHPDQIGTTLDAVRIALSRIEPAALIFEHYAELDHVSEGLPASYEIALDLKARLSLPSELMFWGEKIALRKAATH